MQPGKIDRQSGFILHAQAYRETSLLLDVLTRDYGRVAMVARGARRPRAELRGLLLPFQPLSLAWFGKTELRTLHRAEWQGGVRLLAGQALVCGFYLNELLVRLTVREDPTPAVFTAYDAAVRALAQGEAQGVVLRRFELALLGALGYAPLLGHDGAGAPLDAGSLYRVQAGSPPELWQGGVAHDGQAVVRGAVLLALAAGDFDDAHALREARGVTRLMLANLLGDDKLATRELLLPLAQATEAAKPV
ncbi:DNA repair protein RecO [Craterilacuibacter sinensis]|uniref:DNA repair protein RecO n=1 Tax=Craterilacuibacter sinensis TaxID=2686017 RepID=A0A845BRF9_9NEIS|nr:DNA repair protein RecO [Craterilacuibacter sinensis]MXR36806.1 DNA repair protein RecO [Craterilacuibacter sinensis]RQW29220.1 DNA repair protein RecO [Rhodobacteraceae bacterium CH30]